MYSPSSKILHRRRRQWGIFQIGPSPLPHRLVSSHSQGSCARPAADSSPGAWRGSTAAWWRPHSPTWPSPTQCWPRGFSAGLRWCSSAALSSPRPGGRNGTQSEGRRHGVAHAVLCIRYGVQKSNNKWFCVVQGLWLIICTTINFRRGFNSKLSVENRVMHHRVVLYQVQRRTSRLSD